MQNVLGGGYKSLFNRPCTTCVSDMMRFKSALSQFQDQCEKRDKFETLQQKIRLTSYAEAFEAIKKIQRLQPVFKRIRGALVSVLSNTEEFGQVHSPQLLTWSLQ